jgi:hypothetical protein
VNELFERLQMAAWASEQISTQHQQSFIDYLEYFRVSVDNVVAAPIQFSTCPEAGASREEDDILFIGDGEQARWQ